MPTPTLLCRSSMPLVLCCSCMMMATIFCWLFHRGFLLFIRHPIKSLTHHSKWPSRQSTLLLREKRSRLCYSKSLPRQSKLLLREKRSPLCYSKSLARQSKLVPREKKRLLLHSKFSCRQSKRLPLRRSKSPCRQDKRPLPSRFLVRHNKSPSRQSKTLLRVRRFLLRKT
eukprot:g1930.t1